MLKNGFLTEGHVAFHQIDSMNIMHHSQYIYCLEEARLDFAGQLLGMDGNWFENRNIYLPLSRIYCKYINSMVFDTKYKILTKVLIKDRCQLIFFNEIYSMDFNIKFLMASTEHIFLNADRKMLFHVPEEFGRALEKVKKDFPHYLIDNSEIQIFRRHKCTNI